MSKQSPNIGKPSFFPYSVINFYFELIGKNKSSFFLLNLLLGIFSFIITFWGLERFALSLTSAINLLISLLAFILMIFATTFKFIKNRKLKVSSSKKIDKFLFQTFYKNKVNNFNTVLHPSKIEEEAGYKRIDLPLRKDSILFSKTVNTFLRNEVTSVCLRIVKGKKKEIMKTLEPDAELIKDALLNNYYKSRRTNKMFFNDNKISLLTTPKQGVKTLEVFKSSYYLSYVTNDMSTKNIEDNTVKGKNRYRWQAINKFPYILDPAKKINRIKPLETSNFSNHIGGNTIAFSDNEMILWQQSQSAQRSEDLIAPTGSGSLDIADYENNPHKLFPMLREGMERELSEEGTEKNAPIFNLAEKTKIVGFYRWVGKGGLPGFLGVSKIKGNIALKPNSSEVKLFIPETDEIDMKVNTINELIELIDFLFTNEMDNLSVPLYANLKALKQAAIEDPRFLDFIFS